MANKPESRLTDQQRFDWLRLPRSENVGPRTFRALTTNCGGVRAALNALPELARRGGAKRPIVVASVEEVEKELLAARKLGVRFVALGEPDYPPALEEIDSARARFSAPQSHRLGTRLGCRGGRGGEGFGLAHHGTVRARTKPSDFRRARLSPRSPRPRNQRSPEARGVDLHRAGRRVDRARAGAIGRRRRRHARGERRRWGAALGGTSFVWG